MGLCPIDGFYYPDRMACRVKLKSSVVRGNRQFAGDFIEYERYTAQSARFAAAGPLVHSASAKQRQLADFYALTRKAPKIRVSRMHAIALPGTHT
jgi:hypothetical protein